MSSDICHTNMNFPCSSGSMKKLSTSPYLLLHFISNFLRPSEFASACVRLYIYIYIDRYRLIIIKKQHILNVSNYVSFSNFPIKTLIFLININKNFNMPFSISKLSAIYIYNQRLPTLIIVFYPCIYYL